MPAHPKPRCRLHRDVGRTLKLLFGTNKNICERLQLDHPVFNFNSQYIVGACTYSVIPAWAIALIERQYEAWCLAWLPLAETWYEKMGVWYAPGVHAPFTLPPVPAPDDRPSRNPSFDAVVSEQTRSFALTLFGKPYNANARLGLPRTWGRQLWAGRPGLRDAVQLIEDRWTVWCDTFLSPIKSAEDAYADDYRSPDGTGFVTHLGPPRPFTLVLSAADVKPRLSGEDLAAFVATHADTTSTS